MARTIKLYGIEKRRPAPCCRGDLATAGHFGGNATELLFKPNAMPPIGSRPT